MSGQVLNLVENGPANGKNVNQAPWAGIDRQKWQIALLPNGNYRLINKFSGRSLEVDGTDKNGSNVQKWDWLSFDHQKWQIEPTSVVPVTGVSVNPSTLDLEIGQNGGLNRVITPANASVRSVSWSSSDTSIAEVDRNGLVTGKSVGTANISVTTNDGNFVATATVTVSPLSTSMPLSTGAFNFSTVLIYANPWNNGELKILADETINDLRVYDMTGSLVYSAQPQGKSVSISPVEVRATGILLIHVTTDKGVTTQKVLR